MAGAKEIRSKIKSVQNTQKITKAMEMVAASKMRKAQERMRASRPYAEKMRDVLSHLAQAHCEYKHPYLQDREEVKRVGYIVISTDRGLCGGLNTNMFKKAIIDMVEWNEKGVEIDICTIGKKAGSFFSRFNGKIVARADTLGDQPSNEALIGPDASDLIKELQTVYNKARQAAITQEISEIVSGAAAV